MATPLEIKNSIRGSLSSLIIHMNTWNRSGYTEPGEINNIKDTVYSLVSIVNRLLDIVEIPLDTPESKNEQLSLKAAPFQPECKCQVVQDENGDLTIYHCQYHRSVKYLHGRLDDILHDRKIGILALMNMLYEDRAFLDECKENSLTGQTGKAGDENIGR